jgi:hypothetical protein
MSDPKRTIQPEAVMADIVDIDALRALLEKATKGPWGAVQVNTRDHGAYDPIFVDGLWHIFDVAHPGRVPIAIIDHANDHHPPTREKAAYDAALIAAAVNALPALLSELEGLREAVEWYGEQARLARLIHSEGDAGRHALADDGGKRARAALTKG